MRTASIRAALSGLTAAYLVLSPAFAVTDGWENSDPSRIDPIIADALWKADLSKGGEFILERRDGAEGSVEFSGGRMTIQKTNDKGYLLLRAPAFAVSTNSPITFSADVSIMDAEPECCHAMLRALETGSFLAFVQGREVLTIPVDGRL